MRVLFVIGSPHHTAAPRRGAFEYAGCLHRLGGDHRRFRLLRRRHDIQCEQSAAQDGFCDAGVICSNSKKAQRSLALCFLHALDCMS